MAINPIAFGSHVNSQFRRYQLSAFPLTDPDLAQQARELLGPGGYGESPLVRGPYLSLARAFETAQSVEELIAAGRLHPALAGIAEHPSLFAHQQDTLEAVEQGRHVLVSTGTGSGKTEAFLYPILDHCLRLRDAGASEGIVALLIYPMNALAADQRDRLRRLLPGTGISFGMYVGSTPATRAKVTDVVQMREGEGRDHLPRYRARYQKHDLAIAPWEERLSEEEMAARPPRILLTNVNQLEILLTRAKDLGMFLDAPLRFLVLDEAHTYSGAVGAEVACLVRRIRAITRKSVDQVTCVATSATIVDPEEAAKVAPSFAARLFGVPEERVSVVEERYIEQQWPDERQSPRFPKNPVALLDRAIQAVDRSPEDELPDVVQDLTGQTLTADGDIHARLYETLSHNDLVYRLAEELSHPLHIDEAVRRLWRRMKRAGKPEDGATHELLTYLALGAAAQRDGNPLLRPKVHFFIRGLEGAVVTYEPRGGELWPRLYFSAQEALSSAPDIQPSAVFPVWACRTCGQHFFSTSLIDFGLVGKEALGGNAEGDAVVWLPAPEGDGTRARFTNRFVAEAEEELEEDSSVGAKLASKRVALWLCHYCGAFHKHDRDACANQLCARPGPLAEVWLIIEQNGFRCAGCGATTRRIHGRPVEPIRPLRAVTVADVHILAQDMINATPSERERKLLVFADNRQDAAFQAGWMRDHARRYRLRHLMVETIQRHDGPISIGDLDAELNRRLAADPDLARALAPEAFEGQKTEAFGKEARKRLSYFLRIQVVRELATPMAQRDSLERWGVARVVYAGVEESDADIQELAAKYGLRSEDLTEGISTLLDVYRRQGLLHDEKADIFSRFWPDGHELVMQGFVPSNIRPAGLKLTREEDENPNLVKQFRSFRGQTWPMNFVAKWGLSGDGGTFLSELWEFLVRRGLLEPVHIRGYKGDPVPGAVGTYHVAGSQLGILPQRLRYRCLTCQRIHARPTPASICSKMHCPGRLSAEPIPDDDYNVALLDRPFSLVLPAEHTAMVPVEIRERIEQSFKKGDGKVNTLVATPTLELGVDIGDLDLILLRNVPPTPANYWQRVGRAGRQYRMALIYAYCRRSVHDGYFFEDPERLLGAPIRPPRFNLKNAVMVAKHAHAAILSELIGLTMSGELPEDEAEELQAVLAAAFPPFIRQYLYTEENAYRSEPVGVGALKQVIGHYRERLIGVLERIYGRHWPEEARAEVDPVVLTSIVDGMADALQQVINRLHQRLEWTRRTQDEILERERRKLLDEHEQRVLQRCRDYLRRLAEERRDTYTLSVLATEGFLPGYGLYEGGVTAFAGRGGWRAGPLLFELHRPPSIAVREFVPGNLLYANSGRHRVVLYHFPVGEKQIDPDRYVVRAETGEVYEGEAGPSGYGEVEDQVVEGYPISDSELGFIDPIRDEETERFQMPVTILGLLRQSRRGGAVLKGGAGPIHLLIGQQMRLVNVGPADKVRQGLFGFPVCRVCGAARSPYSSDAELEHFREFHLKRCGREPGSLVFSAEDQVDGLHFLGLESQEIAVNLGEALRTGASQVLEMERDDLELLTLPRSDETWELLLYDPMPGGSGLLQQILERWGEIVAVLHNLLADCPSACETSCYDCLRTGRNVYLHRVLNRHEAMEIIDRYASEPELEYELPPLMDSAPAEGRATYSKEERLHQMLQRAGFQAFDQQQEISIGPPFGRTIPDFSYEHPVSRHRVAIYLDGLSKGIHGAPQTRRKDVIIRSQLEDRGWTVIEIAASDLDDRELMYLHFQKVARALGQVASDRPYEIQTDYHRRKVAEDEPMYEDDDNGGKKRDG